MSTITYSDKPVWQSFKALEEMKRHTLCDGGRLVMDNWGAKYLDVRMDMRTGHVLMREGHVLGDERRPRYLVIQE